MKYSTVTLYYGPTDSFSFPMNESAQTAKYVVKNIEGLDPPSSDIFLGDKASEGSTYQGRRPANREVIITVGLQPDYSIGEDAGKLRTNLYKLMTPKPSTRKVDLYLFEPNASNWIKTWGHVKRIEANPFSKDPEARITMACEVPYFEHGMTYVSLTGMNGANPITFNNEGDAPSGFFISFKLTTSQSSFTLMNEDQTEFIKVNYAFLANDEIYIRTDSGSRYVQMQRGSVMTNLINSIDPGSKWMQLSYGTNKFIPSTTSYQLTGLEFTPRRWGA